MIRLTILVCFPREDEQVPVDWERETRELIHLPGVEEVFWDRITRARPTMMQSL